MLRGASLLHVRPWSSGLGVHELFILCESSDWLEQEALNRIPDQSSQYSTPPGRGMTDLEDRGAEIEVIEVIRKTELARGHSRRKFPKNLAFITGQGVR
ncbi:hypothetical protein CC2G_003348 [Coprinopsis cinerea AmutBmut pab1-1]|nr:hypothetical protein CC2G_003348 [Coprinopsis cinerea AmutBmut pab1-1]